MNSEDFQPWKILHLDLSRQLPGLQQNHKVGGLLVILWSEGRPVGQLLLPRSRLPLNPRQLHDLATAAIQQPGTESGSDVDGVVERDRCPGTSGIVPVNSVSGIPDRTTADWAARVSGPVDCILPALASPPTISVIICTRDRPRDLEQCLDSVRKQQVAPSEVLVVDNAPSSEDSRRLVQRKPWVRYVAEPRPGLSFARNRGIRASRGEVLAFTDDDITVDPRWIGRLIAGFRQQGVLAVTGLCLPAELETAAQWWFEKRWSFVRGYAPRTFGRDFFTRTRHAGCPVWDIGGGGNLAIRREAFGLLGNFDQRLGAGAAGCSEDSEFLYRILAAGWQCRYEPSAVVYHRHRRDFPGLRRQLFYYMRGHVAALLVQFEKHGDIGNLRRALVALPRQYARAVLHWRRHDPEPWQITWNSETGGCLCGLAYYLWCFVAGRGPATVGWLDGGAYEHGEREGLDRPQTLARRSSRR